MGGREGVPSRANNRTEPRFLGNDNQKPSSYRPYVLTHGRDQQSTEAASSKRRQHALPGRFSLHKDGHHKLKSYVVKDTIMYALKYNTIYS